MSLLVLNAGSSSLKYALYDANLNELAGASFELRSDPGEAGRAPRATTQPRAVRSIREAVAQVLESVQREQRDAIVAVGHRVVHGGTRFTQSVRLEPDAEAELERLSELAPLHNPPALEAIAATRAALPGVPQVAVFDTSFYATLGPEHFMYPVPYEWHQAWGIRRFGFHGISHAYCAERAAALLPGPAPLRVVSCHLGNGCSATATLAGRALATTMGFTPLDGLMMGSRPGSLDPGIAQHVQRAHGLSVEQLEHAFNHESGLQGISGVSSDFRAVEAAASEGNRRAQLALQMYALHVRQAIGALAVSLGGIDALIFTGGVGEHSASLRSASCQGLQCLGVQLDPDENRSANGDQDIASSASTARVLVLHTREELTIAREVQRTLKA